MGGGCVCVGGGGGCVCVGGWVGVCVCVWGVVWGCELVRSLEIRSCVSVCVSGDNKSSVHAYVTSNYSVYAINN